MIQSIQIPEGLVSFPVTVNTVMPHPLKRDIVYLGLSHTGMLRWDRAANAFSLIRYPNAPRAETMWMIPRDDGNVWIGVNRWDYARPGYFCFQSRARVVRAPACGTCYELLVFRAVLYVRRLR